MKILSICLIFLFCLLFVSGVFYNSLREEKQIRQSEILREYLSGEITQEQGVYKMKVLSCEIAEKSGSKYNKESCEWVS